MVPRRAHPIQGLLYGGGLHGGSLRDLQVDRILGDPVSVPDGLKALRQIIIEELVDGEVHVDIGQAHLQGAAVPQEAADLLNTNSPSASTSFRLRKNFLHIFFISGRSKVLTEQTS